MKFNLFKKIFRKAEKIYFSTKDNKCHLTDGCVVLQFSKNLKNKIFKNIGFAVDEKLEKFAIVRAGDKIHINKDVEIDIYPYLENVDTVTAKYTNIILDGFKKEKVFDVNEGLLVFNSDYIDMAWQITDTANPQYSKDFKVLYFYGRKVNVFVLPLDTKKTKHFYLSKKFLV